MGTLQSKISGQQWLLTWSSPRGRQIPSTVPLRLWLMIDQLGHNPRKGQWFLSVMEITLKLLEQLWHRWLPGSWWSWNKELMVSFPYLPRRKCTVDFPRKRQLCQCGLFAYFASSWLSVFFSPHQFSPLTYSANDAGCLSSEASLKSETIPFRTHSISPFSSSSPIQHP